MSRDYKPKQKNNSKGSPFLSGFLLGFLLGVIATTALTMYIKGDTSPFQDERNNTPATESSIGQQSENTNTKDTQTTSDFDFYTILPETESTVTEREIKDNPTTIKNDSAFLQVGAFQNEADADNMKAKLALQGFEAVVQTASIPDKGIWHRVRIGPLRNIEQINKVRSNLKDNGFNADLIKVQRETKQ